VCRDRQLETSQDVGGDEHDGRDQEEDAGDEVGEGERVRQGRPARAEAQRTENSLREGRLVCIVVVQRPRSSSGLASL